MKKHRLTIYRSGSSVEQWEPGEPPNSRDRVLVKRDAFPEEWEVSSVKCMCGLEFDEEWEAMEHLDNVAAERAEEPDVLMYPVLVDMFRWDIPWFPTDPNPPAKYMDGLSDALMDERWTAEKLLKVVCEEVSYPEGKPYDTVYYRELELHDEDEEYDRALDPGTEVVRVPRSAVIVDVVPEGVPVRVANRENAMYEFRDLE